MRTASPAPGWPAGGLADLVVRLVAAAPVRAVPVLHALFPGGVDPADDAAGPGWAYRLWALETERALSAIGLRLFPPLRLAGPVIGLVLEVRPGDAAGALADTLASLSGQIYGRWRLSVRGRLPAGAVLPADPRIAADGPARRPRPSWTGWLRPGDTLSAGGAGAVRLCGAAAAVGIGDLLRRGSPAAGRQRRRAWLKTAWDPDAAEAADPVGALLLVRGRGRGPGRAAAARVQAPSPAGSCTCRRCCAIAPAAATQDPPVPPFGARTAPSLPTLSIVIATRDRADLLERCVASLRARTGLSRHRDRPGRQRQPRAGGPSPCWIGCGAAAAPGCTVLRPAGAVQLVRR